MLEFSQIYRPITALPLKNDSSYLEVLPCKALRPYIRCFWGTNGPITIEKSENEKSGIVTPDTCMDIIFYTNFTENIVTSRFCGINDLTFENYANNNKKRMESTFAIRFYAWSAILFSEEDMSEVKNQFFDAGYHFSSITAMMEPKLFDTVTMEKNIKTAEDVLLNCLHSERMNHSITDAVFQILNHRGNLKMGQIAKEIGLSDSQLERNFKKNIGISPKKLASLVRYQYLWNDIMFSKEFRVLDAVEKYGYSDQSHLLRDFKQYHSMLPRDAIKYACE